MDALRVWAMVGVPLIHVSAGGYGGAVGSFNWLSSLFWGSVSRASVPIFLMLTGALLLDPDRALDLRLLWRRRIPRLLASLLFWALVYRLWRLVRWSAGTPDRNILDAVKQTLVFHHQSHLYYLHIALLLYALLPALRLIAVHGDQRTLRYLLVLWAVLGILYPTLKDAWPLTLLTGIPAQYGLNMAYASLGYALLGWYLRKYARRPAPWALTAAAGFLTIFLGTMLLSLREGQLNMRLMEGCSPGVALLAAGLCGWAFTKLRDRQSPKVLAAISRASFCVYLVHMLPCWELRDLGLTAAAGPSLVFIPLTAAAVLGCSLAMWAVLSRVPVVREWLI